MDGYNPPLPTRYWHQEEVPEAAGVRHCTASDLITVAVGYPLVSLRLRRCPLRPDFDRLSGSAPDPQVMLRRMRNQGKQNRLARLSTLTPRCWRVDRKRHHHTPLDLFEKVMVPSVRKKVCYQRRQIRASVLTPGAARALIPRFDLRLAAVKEKYRARVIS
ncbi:predicted protein [Histoplasma capsulatum var. duboisii H88]|uniref:Predicted protein n=1 Tax=Ajellomyces capsulatus (strain H88) TaxID=544711 RepID=F0UKD7_AJEC8|nr:predicted protein [Histoplasma capsulatum var. duboisii H88]